MVKVAVLAIEPFATTSECEFDLEQEATITQNGNRRKGASKVCFIGCTIKGDFRQILG